MNARAAECLVCPHPAAAHDETGCRPPTGMCACAVPRAELPPPPGPVSTPEPDPLVCSQCGALWQPVRRGECLSCGSDAGPVREGDYLPPAPIDVPVDDDGGPGSSEDLADDPASRGNTNPTGPDDAATQADTPGTVLAGDGTGGSTEPKPDDAAARPAQAATGKKRALGDRYDWPAIKRRYVEGVKGAGDEVTDWPSLDAVAAHFAATPSRVRERAAMEGWTEQRRQWQAYVERTRQQAKAAGLARIGSDLDNRAIDATKLGLQLCAAVLTERAQAAQAARSAGGKAGDVLNALELTRLAQAVDLWHRIGLRAVGDPEVARVEITGAGGGPIEISQELRRDDPDRMATVLSVLEQAGMGDIFGRPGGDVASGAVALERGADGTYSAEQPG
jgi:hypothetical protein